MTRVGWALVGIACGIASTVAYLSWYRVRLRERRLRAEAMGRHPSGSVEWGHCDHCGGEFSFRPGQFEVAATLHVERYCDELGAA